MIFGLLVSTTHFQVAKSAQLPVGIEFFQKKIWKEEVLMVVISGASPGGNAARDHTAPQTNRNTDMVNRFCFGANVPDLFNF